MKFEQQPFVQKPSHCRYISLTSGSDCHGNHILWPLSYCASAILLSLVVPFIFTYLPGLIIVQNRLLIPRYRGGPSESLVRIDRDWVLHTAKCTDEKTRRSSGAGAWGTVISWSSTETWHGRSLCPQSARCPQPRSRLLRNIKHMFFDIDRNNRLIARVALWKRS